MEYEVLGLTFVSENLSIKSYEDLSVVKQIINEDTKEVEFKVKLDSKEYEASDEGLIIDGVIIGKPYMEDSNGQQCHSCYYDVNKDDDYLIFKFNLENEWLNDKVYPIYVKLTVKLKAAPLMADDNDAIEQEESDSSESNLASSDATDSVAEASYASNSGATCSVASDVIYNFKSKEILVRKRIGRFVEKLLLNNGYTFKHDDYKKIIYRERECKDIEEIKIKNMYDSFVYLITDYTNMLTGYKLKRFIYLVCGKEINDEFINEIVNKYFELKEEEVIYKVCAFYDYVGNKLNGVLEDNEVRIISYMLLNYALVNNGIPCIVLYRSDYEAFNENKEELLNKVISEAKVQSNEYYASLVELTYEDVEKEILNNKDNFINNYNVKSIYVFGSFAKGLQRLDSDVDLLISFNMDTPSNKVEEYKELIKEELLNKLHRNIDISEKIKIIDDDLLYEMKDARKVF